MAVIVAFIIHKGICLLCVAAKRRVKNRDKEDSDHDLYSPSDNIKTHGNSFLTSQPNPIFSHSKVVSWDDLVACL